MNYLFNTMLVRLFSKYWRVSVILVCSALLLSCERLASPNFEAELVEASPGQYILDKDHGMLLFKLNHYSFSTYIGSFNDINASLDWNPENIENSSLEVVINTASIDVNNPEFEGELRGSNWFDVENYPQATFRTTSFLESEGNSFKFEGDLTLMGITAPVTLSANFNGSEVFTIIVTDGDLVDEQILIAMVSEINDAPLATTGLTGLTNEDQSVVVTLSGSDIDGDNLTFSLDSDASNGSVTIDGSIATYAPSQDFNGSDNFWTMFVF